ncbi:3-oxo-Delta(4, 5)-steroid 5-beta-reductase-like protein [Colletotrichum camelliae]|nr:3-oxo-Delta(4, 5)-steroid 5-beta-reductase-like protein [Colletotrichum camelliae]
MGSLDKNVALVFGASGISAWAVTRNLFSYPTASTFSRIIGLSNRPMDLAESQLPVEDHRLEIYSGINLREDLETIKARMTESIPKIKEVTHVYYCAYSNATAYSQDVMAIRDINVAMTKNAVHAVDQICPNLKFLTLQTGTNNYGVAVFRFQDKIEINPPLKESHPRIPSPYGDEIFYYGQVDIIKEAQKGKHWKWCEVRPDAIVGFVPGMTGMTFLEPIALFLALWRYVHGPGAESPFIGTLDNYVHTNTDSSQDIIAKSEIYLSTIKPDEANGEAFNTADYTTPTSWVTRWPATVSYFGLKGTPPDPSQTATTFPVDKWWEEHQEDYKCMCAEYGLRHRDIPAMTWVFTLVAGYTLLHRNREMYHVEHFERFYLQLSHYSSKMKIQIVIAALATLLVTVHGEPIQYLIRTCRAKGLDVKSELFESINDKSNANFTRQACFEANGYFPHKWKPGEPWKHGQPVCCQLPQANIAKFNLACRGQTLPKEDHKKNPDFYPIIEKCEEPV